MSMQEILEHSLQINEAIKYGIEEVPIKDYQTVLNAYIDTLYMLDRSHERYEEIVKSYNAIISQITMV
jgi:hypothetical protein